MTMKQIGTAVAAASALLLASLVQAEQAAAPPAAAGKADAVAALKQSLQQGMAKIRQYRVDRNDHHQPEGRGKGPHPETLLLRR